jgi:hypothetical protein
MDFLFFSVFSLMSVLWITPSTSLLRPFETNTELISSPLVLSLSIDRGSYSTRNANPIGDEKNPDVQLILALRLRLTNQTKTVVKLDTNCIQLESTVVYDSPFVGPSEALIPDGMVHGNPTQGGCAYRTDEKLLALLPEKSYDTTMRITFQVIDQGRVHPPESLRPGSYFLKINVMTWWQIDGQDEELKEKWRKPGLLVGRIVPSELMALVVARTRAKRRI